MSETESATESNQASTSPLYSFQKGSIDSDPLIKDVVRNSIQLWETSSPDDVASKKIKDDYSKYTRRKWIFLFACIAGILISIGVVMTIGDYPIGFFETYEIIWNHLTGNVQDAMKDIVVFRYRIPRILAGILAGVGLAVSGVVMQSTLMNPLADSYTTGVSSGASLGAVLAVVAGWSIGAGSYAIAANAFVFSLIPMIVIIVMSKIKNASPTTMIMGGIAIMYIFGAFTTLFMLMADPNDLESLYKWSVGSLGLVGRDNIPTMAAFVIVGTIILMFLTRYLNILAAGDDSAKSLGVNADMMRRICLVIVALDVAGVVAFTGTIGFVGLVAPHIVRMFVGPDNRFLLPASAVFGALLLVVADAIGRVIISPAQLQVGVIMAFLGGPLFLWLILRKNTSIWG